LAAVSWANMGMFWVVKTAGNDQSLLQWHVRRRSTSEKRLAL